MINSLVSFCLKCGKKLDKEEIKEGIETKKRGICAICKFREDQK